MNQERSESEFKLSYSERPVKILPEGLKCECGALMQLFTEHRSEHGGQIISRIFVCPNCNNEAGLKLGGGT
ncbi:MAG: hypothetical protein ACE5JI_22020, partial [Acidobacteriota bacterium]